MNMSLSEKIVSGLTIALLMTGLASRVFPSTNMSLFSSSSVSHVRSSSLNHGSGNASW